MAGERAAEPVMVQDKGNGGNGHLRLVDQGTGAVLHGMMSMLSEVLDGLDRRLEAMEARLGEVAEAAAAPVVLPEPPPAPEPDTAVAEAVDRLVARVEALAQSLTDRVSGLDAAIAEQVSALSSDVAEAGQRSGAIEGLVAERLTRLESALAERISALDDAVADRSVEVASGFADRVAALDGVVGERVGAIEAALDRTLADTAVRVEEVVQAALGRRMAQMEASLAESRAEVEAAQTRAGEGLRQGVDEAAGRLAERIGQAEQVTAAHVEGLADRLARAEEALSVQAAALADATAERIGQAQQAIVDQAAALADGTAERVAQAEQATADRIVQAESATVDRIAQAEQATAERVAQAESATADHVALAQQASADHAAALADRMAHTAAQHADTLADHVTQTAARHADAAAQQIEAVTEPISLQLSELDAALAALRAETAGMPANVGEQVQQAIGSWRNRLRRGDGDGDGAGAATKAIDAAATALTNHLNDGLTRIHEAVNRAQGETLEAAQTTTAEVRRLLDAARADTERQASEQLDGSAAIAERLVTLHEDLSRRDARLAQVLKQATEATSHRIAEAEVALTSALNRALTADDPADEEARAWLTDELNRIRDAIQETHVRTGSVAAKVARQVDEVVQAAVAAVQERVAQERTTTDTIRRDVELLGSRIEELGKSVSAGRREFAITAQGLPELISSVMPAIDVDAITAADKAVLDAVNAANDNHQEVLQALHASLAKRFDARTRAIAETLESLSASLEAARTLGPSLDKVSTKLESQQPHLDQIRSQLVQLAATVTSVPADVERRHNEATASLDRVTDGLSALRKHAAALDRAVQAMRTSQDGLSAAFIDLRDGNGVVPQRLDQITTALDATRRQLTDIAESSRTLTGAVDQQQATGNRIAELVTQVRAATRSDIERVESSIHLEVLKQHQQDQARLTQAVAGVSEVVEREAGVIAQRVSVLANEVDAIRLELAGRQDTP